MGERVFIALGSNLEAEKNIIKSMLLLKERVSIISISNFYQSAAVAELREAEDFINGVIEIETGLEPYSLKYEILREVEARIGRVRGRGCSKDKVIDLDLILYGERRIENRMLKLPDPNIISYPFISIPLLELTPEVIVPGSSSPLSSQVDRDWAMKQLKLLSKYSLTLKELF